MGQSTVFWPSTVPDRLCAGRGTTVLYGARLTAKWTLPFAADAHSKDMRRSGVLNWNVSGLSTFQYLVDKIGKAAPLTLEARAVH
jgi:hypothetical protein